MCAINSLPMTGFKPAGSLPPMGASTIAPGGAVPDYDEEVRKIGLFGKNP